MIKKIALVLLIVLVNNSCTRDDICSEGTLTTPLLVIEFKDISNPTESKNVTGLSVFLLNTENTPVLPVATTAQISIPLDTSNDVVRYQFLSDSASETPNLDVLVFRYAREDIYVNRACAFKTIYNNVTLEIVDEGPDNWIISSEINISTVENENETHITIFH